MSEAAIICRDIRKRYPARPKPVEAVNGLDLEVRQGECFGLLGPNGAGKTTTVEILEGLSEPTSGEVEVLGMRWGRDDKVLRQRMGVSLQETRLTDNLTVLETITLFRSFFDKGAEPIRALEEVSLNEKANSYVSKLSGGQHQRLAVACALVGDPDILFLDEPTTGLDPQSRRQLWDIIRKLKAQGRTVMITTHYMDEAERLCDRVGIVDYGKMIALGTPKELIAQLGGEHLVEFEVADATPDLSQLEQLPSAQSARLEDGVYSLTVAEPHVILPALLSFLRDHDWELTRLTTRHASLEDVFVNLTGRHLHEG